MSEKVAIPVGEQDKVQDSGSPLENFKTQETIEVPQMTPRQEQVAIETARSIQQPKPIEVEPIEGYYDQGENVVEVTVGPPQEGGASPSEAPEVDTEGADSETSQPVDSSQQPEGTEETPSGAQPSPNTSSAAFKVSVDECPGTAEGFCKRKTLAAKWQPKHGRCEKCGVALTKEGKHRKRRNDVGSSRK